MSNTEIVSLTDEQLEVVSGGAGKVYFNFKVAGMKVSAGVNDNGKTWGLTTYGDVFVLTTSTSGGAKVHTPF
jgi:hypothetical protein